MVIALTACMETCARAQASDSATVEKLRNENFRLRLEVRALKAELEKTKGASSAISSLDAVSDAKVPRDDAFFSLTDSWDSLSETASPGNDGSGADCLGIPANDIYYKYMDIYTVQRHRSMVSILARYDAYLPMLRETFDRYGIPSEVTALCIVESACNARALSKAGAAGLWQLRAATAVDYGLKVQMVYDERYHPEKSTDAAARFLLSLKKEFGDWRLALCAYNCGQGTLRKAIEKAGRADYDAVLPLLPRETRDYLPALRAAFDVSRERKKYDL